MVLPTSRRLRHVWSWRTDAELVGYPEATGCFNTGFFLFRPSQRRRWEHERLLAATADEARGRYPRGDKRCVVTRHCCKRTCEPNDQPYLNAVYSARSALVRQLRAADGRDDIHAGGGNASLPPAYLPIAATALHMRTSTRYGCQYSSCRSCLVNTQQLTASDDAFHFYSRLAPWRGDCARCALRGKLCNYSSLPAYSAALGIDEATAPHTCGRAAAQLIWFDILVRGRALPPRLRNLCLARLEAATAHARASCTPRNRPLVWKYGRPGVG